MLARVMRCSGSVDGFDEVTVGCSPNDRVGKAVVGQAGPATMITLLFASTVTGLVALVLEGDGPDSVRDQAVHDSDAGGAPLASSRSVLDLVQ